MPPNDISALHPSAPTALLDSSGGNDRAEPGVGQQPPPTGGTVKPGLASSNGNGMRRNLFANARRSKDQTTAAADNKKPSAATANNQQVNNQQVNNQQGTQNVTNATTDLIAGIGANFRHTLELEGKAITQLTDMVDSGIGNTIKSANKFLNM